MNTVSQPPAGLCSSLAFEADNEPAACLPVFTFSVEVQSLGAAAWEKPLCVSVTLLTVPAQKPWKGKVTGAPRSMDVQWDLVGIQLGNCQLC